MSIERTTFFNIMSSFASGVTVVTSAYEERLIGITVSAFASLSAEPMLVVVCVNTSIQSHDALRASGKFAVNILEESQADLSAQFASRLEDKFTGIEYVLGEQGLPLLAGTLGYIECRIVEALPGGDHTIFVGEALGGDTRPGRPLLYFQRHYHQIAEND